VIGLLLTLVLVSGLFAFCFSSAPGHSSPRIQVTAHVYTALTPATFGSLVHLCFGVYCSANCRRQFHSPPPPAADHHHAATSPLCIHRARYNIPPAFAATVGFSLFSTMQLLPFGCILLPWFLPHNVTQHTTPPTTAFMIRSVLPLLYRTVAFTGQHHHLPVRNSVGLFLDMVH